MKHRGDVVTGVGEETSSRVLDILELIEDFGRFTTTGCYCSSRVLMERKAQMRVLAGEKGNNGRRLVF